MFDLLELMIEFLPGLVSLARGVGEVRESEERRNRDLRRWELIGL